jgi:hypothetical protein
MFHVKQFGDNVLFYLVVLGLSTGSPTAAGAAGVDRRIKPGDDGFGWVGCAAGLSYPQGV